MQRAFLSSPAARPTRLGNCRPASSIGSSTSGVAVGALQRRALQRAPAIASSVRGRLRGRVRTGRGGRASRAAVTWIIPAVQHQILPRIVAVTQDELKTLVGQAALQYVVPGEIVGVGTGSTVNKFIDALAAMKDRIRGAVSSSDRLDRAAAGAGHPGVRHQRGRRIAGLHRRRRRDRRPRLHDQGRRRRAHAREDRRRAVQALRLHRRRIQAGGSAGRVSRCRWR